MSSRYAAARPKRAGENFARTHHNEDESDSKRVKFDVRNPSTLAPDAREDDAVLDADVIGGSNATKRGAVNLDGYDSDSDNETFNARAATRKTGDVNWNKLDNYDAESGGADGKTSMANAGADDDDDDDMFAADDKVGGDTEEPESADFDKSGRKKKDVRFLDASTIQGQEDASKSGGHVRLDDQESSDDEEDVELAMQEEGLDEEIGAGGLKRNAPKVEAFNLREEMEEGRFDQEGNYVRKAGDPDAQHDNWLSGVSKKDMKKAAEAHERREAEARKQRIQEDGVLVSDLLSTLIVHLEKAETPLEALARLGKSQTKPTKKIPKWKLKKMNKGADGMDVDPDAAQDPEQARLKQSINAITDAADKLLSRDYEDVYDQERELLVREYRRETGEDWVEPASRGKTEDDDTEASADGTTWEFRWTDGRDGGGTQGPFDTAMMKAWQDAGYFGEGVEFRRADGGGDWSQTVTFT
ncbi:GYF domain-containingprotein [Purpureocillium lavendulum]|uniref:GYF domain-containingprotein n=1 Tax=Purpureocillium lavendulum TaxID=1247861 RepID=A0AB34FRM5_9HYPO|nr:GYF domain-containingprotein [Purpureocillium lavendulum]